MNKQQLINKLKPLSEFSGMVPATEVIKMLEKLEGGGSGSLSEDQISKLAKNISDSINSEGTSVVSDYDLSMSYREVELDSIDFNTSDIRDIVEDTLKHYLSTRKEEAAA